jgi:flagellar biosynthesis/type III secretory pathway protein FliH
VSVVTQGRVLRKGSFEGKPLHASAEAPALPKGRRIVAAEVEAQLLAQRIVATARESAERIVHSARHEAAALAEKAAEEARQAEQAKVAALYLLLRTEDERRTERDLDRAMSLAVLLAERLLGQALDQRPELVAALARQALAEARGARRATIEAHPLDAEALQRHLVDIGLSETLVEVRPSAELSRGSLRVQTNLGTLDAKLAPQLERLAKALRDALEP